MTGRPRRRPTTPTPWCELTAVILDGMPALPNALCRRTPPQLFDGDTDETRATAIAICQRCPEIQNCRQWVATLPQSRRPSGVVAGKYRRSNSNEIHEYNSPIRKDNPNMDYQPNSNSLVPLVVLALEIGTTADELASRFGDAVTLDAAGIRCVSTERAGIYVAAHRGAQKDEQEILQRQQAEFQARMAELDRRNRAQRTSGRPAVSGNAYADMIAGDQR